MTRHSFVTLHCGFTKIYLVFAELSNFKITLPNANSFQMQLMTIWCSRHFTQARDRFFL